MNLLKMERAIVVVIRGITNQYSSGTGPVNCNYLVYSLTIEYISTQG